VTLPHAAGAVDVRARNAQLQTTRADAFEYRVKDTRANPDLPSPTATIVFGASRLFAGATDGVTAQTLSGRCAFTSFDQGTFSLHDLTASEAAPAIAERDRSGPVSQSTESLGKAFLMQDQARGLS